MSNLVKMKQNKKDTENEISWRIDDYLRNKSEPERIEFQKKVWDSIDSNEELGNDYDSLTDSEKKDALWRMHGKTHRSKIFDKEYPGIKKILIKQIKDGDY